MKVEISNKLLPEAKEVFLRDSSCVATYDTVTEKWSVDTALDACSTTLTKNDDGTLAFSNKLQINAFRREIKKVLSGYGFALLYENEAVESPQKLYLA